MKETRDCPDCGSPFSRRNPKARWPLKCDACRKAPRAVASAPVDVVDVAAPAGAEIDVIAIITALGLDYLVGSAVRFLLEIHDGDELQNLRTALQYVERAIAAREAA